MKHSSQKLTRPVPKLASTAAASVRRHKTTLPNGVRMLTEELPDARSFSLGVWIDAGSCDEAANEHGMAHLLEHVVFRGTQARSARTIANYLESVGGYVNAFTTKDHTCYYTRALTQHFTRSLDLIADIVARPTLREADIEKERSIILEEIKSLDDEPEELVNDELDKSLFGRHPYAHPISGTPRSVTGITPERVAEFHRAHYDASSIIVAVAGNVRHENACKEAERFLGNMQQSEHAHLRRTPRVRPAKRTETRKAVQQAHYVTGALMLHPSDAEYYALSALNIILGDGMSSRLNQSIREKRGVCYNVYSSVSDMHDCAIVSVYAAMEPSNLALVERLVKREIAAILEKFVTKAELRRAKEQLKSSLIIGLESLSGRMNLLAKSEMYVGRYDEVEQRVAAIDAISESSILALAQKYLQPAAWHEVVMLPEE